MLLEEESGIEEDEEEVEELEEEDWLLEDEVALDVVVLLEEEAGVDGVQPAKAADNNPKAPTQINNGCFFILSFLL